jgi:large subunit ribosomal protein L6
MAKQRSSPIPVPKDAKVTITGSEIKVQGPLGTLQLTTSSRVSVEQKDNTLLVKNRDNTKASAAHQGTTRSLIINMINGVTKGYEKQLIIQGTGYRAQMSGTGLQLFLGYAQPVTISLPKEIKCELKVVKSADKGDLTYITLSGVSKQQVGDIAAVIRKTRSPDPYKHKGVRYGKEVLRKKVGKRAVVQG